MNSNNSIAIAAPRMPLAFGTPNLIFWMITISLLPVMALFAGMKFLVVALAVGLAFIVWERPVEAPAAGMLFVLGSTIILPSSARLDYTRFPWEMYYWAGGLFLITLAAMARLGLRRLLAIPAPAKAFAVVTLAASVQGLVLGARPSNVMRGAYGALMLVAYLAIALHVGNESLLLRRILTFGAACALCFLIYYAAVFSEYGFHKEISAAVAEAAFLAALLFAHGTQRWKLSWILRSAVLLLVTALLFSRGYVLTFLFAVWAAFAMKIRAKKLRLLSYAAAALIWLPVAFPPVTQYVAKQLVTTPVIGKLLPTGARNASSLEDRAAMLYFAVASLRSHPFLGHGLGAEFHWVLPTRGLEEQQYVDNGWAYVLFKMGIVGAAVFLWLLVTMLRALSRRSAALSACLLSAILLGMIVEPLLLNFQTAPILGSFAGILLAKKYRDRGVWPSGSRSRTLRSCGAVDGGRSRGLPASKEAAGMATWPEEAAE